MTKEAPILKRTLMKASQIGNRLFRNNRGMFYTMDGRPTRAGLEASGASDCIGFARVTITPDMVGKTIAALLVVETKKSSWKKPSTKTEKEQQNFINFVNENGGIGFFLTDPENLQKAIDERIANL